MTAATPWKTSLENEHLRSCDDFAVIPSCLHSAMLAKYTTTRLQLNAQVVVITTKYGNFALLVSRVRAARAARAARLLSNIRPIKFLYCVIAAAVVDAKAPSKICMKVTPFLVILVVSVFLRHSAILLKKYPKSTIEIKNWITTLKELIIPKQVHCEMHSWYNRVKISLVSGNMTAR